MKRTWWVLILLASCGTPAEEPATRTSTGELKVAVGQRFACVLDRGVGVYCWGDNSAGQLGAAPSTIGVRETLELVPGTEEAIDLALGSHHACVRTADDVLCWGANNAGQVGSSAPIGTCRANVSDGGDPNWACQPVPTSLGLAAIALNADGEGTCVVLEDGTGTCLGVDAPQASVDLVQMSVTRRASCALDVSGGLHCAGDQLLSATPGFMELPASQSLALGDGGNACVVTNDGEVMCAGSSNSLGQLGSGDTEIVQPWLSTNPASGMVEVVSGQSHFCALSTAGGVSCWGGNNGGQLGLEPPSVDGGAEMIEGQEPPQLTNCPGGPCRPTAAALTKLPVAKQLAAGGSSSCVVSEDDEVLCWGAIADGATPQVVAGPW